MKKLFLLSLFAFSLAIGTQAQVSRSAKSTQKVQSDRGHQMHKEQMKDLNLSKEQKVQMKEFNQEAKSRREAIKNNTLLSADQKKAQMEALRNDLKSKRNTILNRDQVNKMKKMKKEKHMSKKMKKNDHGKSRNK